MAHALLWNYKVSQWRFGPEDLRPPPHGRTKRTVLMHREIIEHRMGYSGAGRNRNGRSLGQEQSQQ